MKTCPFWGDAAHLECSLWSICRIVECPRQFAEGEEETRTIDSIQEGVSLVMTDPSKWEELGPDAHNAMLSRGSPYKITESTMDTNIMIGNLEDGREINIVWDGKEWHLTVRDANGFWLGPWSSEMFPTAVERAHFDLGLSK